MQAGMENPLFRIISQSQKKDNEPMTQQSNVNINTQFGSTVASNNQNMTINNTQYLSGNGGQLNPFANQTTTVVSPGQDNIQTVYNPNQTIQGEMVKTIDPKLNQPNNQQSIFGSQTTGQDSKMTINNQYYLSGNNIGTDINNVNKNTLVIDIAQAPGGVDYPYAAEKGIKALYCPALPGRVAPYTAAKILKNAILRTAQSHF